MLVYVQNYFCIAFYTNCKCVQNYVHAYVLSLGCVAMYYMIAKTAMTKVIFCSYLWYCIHCVKVVFCTYVGHYYPTLKQIRNILKPNTSGLAVRWHDLGTQLLTDDTVGVLDVIKADHPNDVIACCNKMFVKWLELQPTATWSQLITALSIIGMKTTAENVIKHLIKGLCSNHFINIWLLLKATLILILISVKTFASTCIKIS